MIQVASENRSASVAIFLAAFFWALMQHLFGLDASAFGHGFESSAIAGSLVSTGQFRDPFGMPTGPTAHLSPVYPALLAAGLKLFGHSALAAFLFILLNSSFLACAAVLLITISREVYGRSAPGVVAAILIMASARNSIQSEAFCLLALMTAATAFALKGRLSWGSLSSGASILANPPSVLFLPLVATRRGKRFATVLTLSSLLVCVPWIVRNWVVLGIPYFIRDNFGLELYISNHNSATAELATNPVLASEHPAYNVNEAKFIALYGESAYNSMRLKDATRWIKSHPDQFGWLSAQRIWYYWFPSLRQGWPAFGYWGITILALPGVWMARRNRSACLIFFAGLAYSLPYIVVQGDLRYRFPSLWAQALPAGYALCRCATSRSGSHVRAAAEIPSSPASTSSRATMLAAARRRA